MKAKKMCFGLIVGNRGFFPDELAREGYAFIKKLLTGKGYDVVVLGPEDTKFGSVETWEDAKKCAALFKSRRDDIDGVIVTLPNFGDERGIADSLKLAGIDVPVLIHAWADNPKTMTIKNRRDSFCGKISACNNLVQYNIPFSLTSVHTMDPTGKAFMKDLEWFAAVCRVVKGIRTCRLGALGARPAAFQTTRFSEKLLQDSGITVETLDLSEAFGRAAALPGDSSDVAAKLKAIKSYVTCAGIPKDALVKMARIGVVIDNWMKDCDLDITAVQCWTSFENYFGVTPCTLMSMMSDALKSSACEVDAGGAIGMHALALASQNPSFLVDWNNNYGEDPDKCVAFHCSNFPKSCLCEMKMDYQEIIAGTVGKEQTYGTVVGRVKAKPMTYARISTFDEEGVIGAFVGEGKFTDDKLATFGGYGVAKIPDLQGLLEYICMNGFEHHVAMNLSSCSQAVYEAFDNYLGWDVYLHQG
jgi:L-fucose isomerase-like protein